MGFRIEEISLVDTKGGSRWRIHFKGLGGEGVYATFFSGTDGHGLFTLDLLELGTEVAAVPDSKHFVVDPAGSPEEVEKIVAAWMMLQGWGPEVDQRRQVVQREPLVRLIDTGDGSGDALLEFSPTLLQLLGWAETQQLKVTAKHGVLSLRAVDNTGALQEAPREG